MNSTLRAALARRCGGFWSVALVAELITQKGDERLKLRNRCVQQLISNPRLTPHRAIDQPLKHRLEVPGKTRGVCIG